MKNPVFISYAREDAAFTLRLAADLKNRAANVWLDQLDIRPGRQWDREVENALMKCHEMLVILSPAAIDSNNVMDEIAFALEERKIVIPVLHRECRLPFRLRRLQYIDLKSDYENGLKTLVLALAEEEQIASEPAHNEVEPERAKAAERVEEERLEHEKAEAAKRVEQERLERETAEAAKRVEQERLEREKAEAAKRAEEERLERESAEAAKYSNAYTTATRVGSIVLTILVIVFALLLHLGYLRYIR